jgi:hypothetical protein
MIKLITYSDEEMTLSAGICLESAVRNNVDIAEHYTPGRIDDQFVTNNAKVLSAPRGAGYWLWKPYFIDQCLDKDLKDGDFLIYCDAGVEIVNNIRHITDRMIDDIFLFGNTYEHAHWCKMDVIKAICPVEKTGKQVQASVIVIRNSEKSRAFVKKWLDYCQRPGFIDDSKSVSDNHPEFREHRHDQAILTCLAYKAKMKLHWWPAIYNAGMFTYDRSGYNDLYPVVFHHHRFRNGSFKDGNGVNRNINLYFRSKRYKTLSGI